MLARTPHRRAAVSTLAAIVWVAGCGENLLPDPESRAVALPVEADMAAGSTHDVLVVACQDRVTLGDVLAPAVFTAIFVALGRLDAILYLPDAQAAAFIPSCDPVDYAVSEARVDGAGLVLETTANPSAFNVQASDEGEGTFRALVTIDGEHLEVASTLRAWTPNRIEFAPACEADEALPILDGWVPAGGTVAFTHRLLRDDRELAGYGLAAAAHPRIEITPAGRGSAAVTIAAETGPFTVTSPFDPDFALDLTAYDVSAYDAFSLTRESDEVFFVGEVTALRIDASIGGSAPCLSGFPREVVIETPEICGFDGRPDLDATMLLRNGVVGIVALAPGRCDVRATLPGTAFTETAQIPVFETFEPLGLGTELDLSQEVLDVAAVGSDDVVIVGWDEEGAGRLDGLVLRRTGGSWAAPAMLRGSSTLRAAGGTSDEIVAVGNDGRVVRLRGTEWTMEETGIDEELVEVWVFAANDVYAAGDEGTLVHWDGTSWSVVPLGVTGRPATMWGAPDGDLYVGFAEGSIVRWDGSAANDFSLPGVMPLTSLASIHGFSATDLYVTTFNRVFHFGGTATATTTLDHDAGDSAIDGVPASDGTVYVLRRRGTRAFVDRVTEARVVSLPLGGFGAPVALDVEGDTVWALTEDGLHRYVHDPSVAFP